MDSINKLSRRSFVAAAAGAVALGAAGLTAQAAEEAPAGSDYDVVIVGMGGAGMTAAISAVEAGAEKVALIEALATVGGCTNFASSGMNAAGTRYQQEAGGDAATDTVELFIEDTMTGGYEMNNIDLVTKMCSESAAAIDWLDEHGITLSDITTMAGASVPRCHRPADKSAVGAFIVPLLESLVEENESIDVIMETRATEIILEDGAVAGIKATDADGNEVVFNTKSLVLATGGFGANFDMIKMYRPDLADFITTNSNGSQGDGMVMAQAAGANLINMDQIQTHPTVYKVEGSTTGSLVGEAVRGSGAIIINVAGDRFTNEMGTRDVVSAAELAQPDGKVWLLYDQTLQDATPVTVTYDNRGMVISGDTIEDLAAQLGVDAAELQATIDTYNESVNGAEDPFGRKTGFGEPLTTAPWHAIPITPGIHHCMGGVYINTNNEALSIKGEVVPGLFAVGECTGGIHGSNRLGGNAVCDIITNGISTGKNAAAAK